MATDDVCAIMFECVQGEGGVLNLNKEFVKAIEEIAKEKDILMVVDEVQTGNYKSYDCASSFAVFVKAVFSCKFYCALVSFGTAVGEKHLFHFCFLAIEEIAKEKDILMVVDEVQTGNGRTGKYFAYMNFGIKPDIVSTRGRCSKGLIHAAIC